MNTNQAGCCAPNAVENASSVATLTPRCDIWEDADGVHLSAEMPGVEENALEVTLERNVLTIVGRMSDSPAPKGQQVWAEFERGEYRRSFQLSGDADASGIVATLKNGLLDVRVPRRQPAQRRIPVMSS